MSTRTMQRVRLPGNRQAVVEEAPVPEPHGDEVLVRVRASALCGSDLHGLYRPAGGSPVTPGHEFAGEVAAIDRASRVRPGDRVAVHAAPGCGDCRFCRMGAPIYCPDGHNTLGFARDGGDATYALVPERACLPLPGSVSFEAGALIGDGVGTPYHALCKAGGVRGGQMLGVFGLGPVGLGATMLGVYFGATVVGVDVNPERLALARRLGAAHTIDPQVSDPVAAIRELTGGRGLPVAMECAGSAVTLGHALAAMDHFGRLALVGEHRQAAIDPSGHFIGRELTMTGSRYYHHGDYDAILQLLAGGLQPERMVTHRFALDEASEAFRLFDAGQTAKVLLLP
jgi:threonine dehydrogenase-like Zn-dependent dehydrogenase